MRSIMFVDGPAPYYKSNFHIFCSCDKKKVTKIKITISEINKDWIKIKFRLKK